MMLESCAFLVRSYDIPPCLINRDNPKSIRFGITQVEANDRSKKTNATDEQVIDLLFGREETNEVNVLDLESIMVRRGSKFYAPLPGRNAPHCQVILEIDPNQPMSRWTCKQIPPFFVKHIIEPINAYLFKTNQIYRYSLEVNHQGNSLHLRTANEAPIKHFAGR
jgi:hypothetical protein